MYPAGIHVPRPHTHIPLRETEIISCGRFQEGFLLLQEHRRVAKAQWSFSWRLTGESHFFMTLVWKLGDLLKKDWPTWHLPFGDKWDAWDKQAVSHTLASWSKCEPGWKRLGANLSFTNDSCMKLHNIYLAVFSWLIAAGVQVCAQNSMWERCWHGCQEKPCRLFTLLQAGLSPAVTYNTPSFLVFPLQPITQFISLKHGYPESPVSHVPPCWKNPTRLSSGKHTSVTKEKTVSSF